ncbi:MAG: SURF1 family protein [Candidatus Andeanibacterium colombiense]|uniref:SURF1-like protein n=1 Tax=Candidatus Andeanibacterium colombiense TaxID=3121345 RepID=A0AAJ5X5L2_9SPHN|nr:MAG: SURF1 family protein [Sphingomonadaceae bacterium]
MTSHTTATAKRGRRGLIAALAVLAAAFLALGVWQVERRTEKLALIAAVDRRIDAAPGPAPGPALWPRIDREHDLYRRVTVRGVFEHQNETPVQAVTDLGAGYWIVTPLRTDAGWRVLINRGFVPQALRERATRRQGESQNAVTVNGLLRITEPGGAFLRRNNPARGRWYSRDVAAIGNAKHLPDLAPYFIDAAAAPAAPGQPIGGLTVVSFYNHHLEYALTWFALALMALGGIAVVRRD